MSLLKDVRVMQKNHIIFNHGDNHYYVNIDNENKINIFNIVLMNIFLEQFEETIGKVTFHDIVSISTLENHDTTISILPNKLKHLTIMSTMCNSFVLQGEVCENIETIRIDKSNITQCPNIGHCPNLRACIIIHSAIDNFNHQFQIPHKLEEFNLQANLLKNLDTTTQQAFVYRIDIKNDFKKDVNKKLKKINLSDNYLKYDDVCKEIRGICNLIRQGTYKHNNINFNNVANVNVQNFINQQVGGVGTPAPTSSLFGGQNVHLSSINTSILNSVIVMQTFITTHNIPTQKNMMNDLEKHLENHILKLLETNCKSPTINMSTSLTYLQTFQLIWTILCYKHQQKEIVLKDVCERIAVELLDGKDMCFTGKYNRLINSMVGIIEGVQVGFSTQEQLQLEFEMLLKTFQNRQTNIEDAFSQLYCGAITTLEFTPNHLKKSWMEAILDLAPSPVIWTYNNETYYRTWDDEILSLREKECVGFYQENDKNLEKGFILIDSLV